MNHKESVTKEIKITYIEGLGGIVEKEISNSTTLRGLRTDNGSIYAEYCEDLEQLFLLRSPTKIFLVSRDKRFNPGYISRHKAILGNLISKILQKNKKFFKTFSVSAAGSNTPEIKKLISYVKETFDLENKEKGDLKIHIAKNYDDWEVGVEISPRPLSVRSYRAKNMSGAMNPTTAYALNSLCITEKVESYLNVFCGSATLLIEVANEHKNLKKITGFDNNKKTISLAIQNIKKADLIRNVDVKFGDIFEKPNLGKFDVVTADLPFGMKISKGQDLLEVYSAFLSYSAIVLNRGGTLGLYTPKEETIEKALAGSGFVVIKKLPLKIITNVGAYLRPAIYICKLQHTNSS